MSDSFRTEPPARIADRRHPRDSAGDLVYPRFIERRPYPGDLHPLPKKQLRWVLSLIPLKYWHGLAAIECRARPAEVGQPFGMYRRDEKSIVLYSLPSVWEVSHLSPWLERSLREFHATALRVETGFRVTWLSDAVMSLWFMLDVFTHELAHHYDRQYRNRKKEIRGVLYSELQADLIGSRINTAFFDAWNELKRSIEADGTGESS